MNATIQKPHLLKAEAAKLKKAKEAKKKKGA
jgi:hypothetical protein